ncbi:pirin family protein, partial [Parabacteroides sp. OttesenSCG-928-G07]|nr:pirin family protein [Parabacteroides sp. OttesenSCG-928-G07]
MKRKVIETVTGTNAIDGAGVHLVRVLGPRTMYRFDPFLMLDAFDSKNPSDYIKGFPYHPHRGIETLTYIIKGKVEHADSLGNKGVIHDGESQWMTAGSGIIHQEMPQPTAHFLGLQLWINLPKKDKMTIPKYFDITNEMIPVVEESFGTIRVISGEYNGHKGAKGKH